MAETFELEIVTPEKLVVKDVAEEAQIPGKDGYLGILPGHAPLITELAIGEISYKTSGVTKHICVAWGFAEVLPNKVTILAETAERPEEIDTTRAQKAKDRAEKELAAGGTDLDYDQVQASIARADTRLDVAKKQ
jgi:F-type H+-transporting ATPase subunit epsilon